ncbi:MAG TPA: hypothetical protein VFI78_05510 [Salinimicrobium sp.]|nr:hypothetical protein [Salinimicrobium sp.]
MSTKVQTAIRLNQNLIDALKEKAKADQRSLNNYIEMVLRRDIGNIPNAETIAAIEEAQDESKLETIDDVKGFFANF